MQYAAYLRLTSIVISAAPISEPALAAGCSVNEDCPGYSACRQRLCINPCAEENPCSRNANCKVVNHKAVCSCPDGYIGTPETDCKLRKYCDWFLKVLLTALSNIYCPQSWFLAEKPECVTDPECPDYLACIRETCQDPCTTLTCGINADCSVSQHRPICACKLNYEGDPYSLCRERKLKNKFYYTCLLYTSPSPRD